jgi:Mn2+/Fe2+ NRAMP family transporter
MATPPKAPPGILSGAAFLMAVSAIGPGFLTQTTQFTVQLGANLAFAILLSILIDIGAQLNTWRTICISRKRGNELADAVFPGLGLLVTLVIVIGSFLFNVGNLSGCALGLDALFGLNQDVGIVLSGLLAVGLFMLPQMLKGIDWFSKLLGAAMILITLYVVFKTWPPVGEAALRSVAPTTIDATVIVTLIGGTIGGYIMFSGAHRLLDGGVAGPEYGGVATRAAVTGIVVTGIMRIVLFLAVLGVVSVGARLSNDRPVFDAFRAGAGNPGYFLSGMVFWAAAITSVVGCSYTSISFLRLPGSTRRRARWIIGFTLAGVLATLIVRWCGFEATPVLIAAGRINGILLPVIFGVILVAAHQRSIMGDRRPSLWASIFGIAAWLATVVLAGWNVALMTN